MGVQYVVCLKLLVRHGVVLCVKALHFNQNMQCKIHKATNRTVKHY